MKPILWSIILLLPLIAVQACEPAQQTPANAEEELTELLEAFLANADDPQMHDRFWAEELIYTSSDGTRRGKQQILEGMQASPEEGSDQPETEYRAEDIQIQLHGDVAVVAFQLVGETGEEVMNYLNSGTFVHRDGEWRVVNWQATHMAD